MYQSNFFFMNEYDTSDVFCPIVTSAFKILADNTYFHYCDNEEKTKHHIKTIAFIRCTEGKGKIYLTDREFVLKENECIFLNFQDIKKYKSLSDIWGYRWVNFVAEKTENEFELNRIYKIPFSEEEDKAFCKLLSCGQTDIENKNYLLSLFLSYFYSVMFENKQDYTDRTPVKSARLIDEMCSYINQKLYSKISIDEVAAFFKISPRRLHQIFTEELNISPKKYILKKKMEEGYRMLVQTTSPINKIAYMLSFSSPYHFSNEFKKTFGQSPSDVRKMEQRYSKKD